MLSRTSGLEGRLAPLAPREGHVHRPRLTSLLEKSVCRPATVVSAPAGFGKTCAMADWWTGRQEGAGAPSTLVWLALTPADDTPAAFVLAFSSAIAQGRLNGSEGYPHPSVRHGGGLSLNRLADLFVRAPSVEREEVIVVLDDYHHLSHRVIHRMVSGLIEEALPHVRLVLLTRSELPFSLARVRAGGRLSEIRADALRFTAEEVTDLLGKRTADTPSVAASFARALAQRGKATREAAEPKHARHRRASLWFEGRGLLFEAIEHALCAQDFDRASWLISRSAPDLSDHLRETTLARWLGALPPGILDRNPQLVVAHATTLLFCGQTAAAATALARFLSWRNEEGSSGDGAGGVTQPDDEADGPRMFDELRPATRHPSAWVSPQELKVLQLIACGSCNKDIARDLSISISTVKSHVCHLFEKLNADNRTHAVARARERNLLP